MLRADDLAPVDLFQVLWQRRIPAIAAALVCGVVGYGYSLFVPDRYSAGTLVLVEDSQPARDYVQSTSTANLGARLRTLRDQILSRSRLDHLMREYALFGNPTDPAAREVEIGKLRRRISVDVTGTEAFRVSFSHEDPVIAAAVANDLAAYFMNDSAQALELQVENTSSALRDQLERVRGLLDAKESDIRDFKNANMGMLPEQLAANLETLDRLQQQLADNSSRQSRATDRRQQLQMELAKVPDAGSPLSAREQARQVLGRETGGDVAARIASQPPRVRLEALRLQRESLLRSYTARHPDVLLVESQIASLERDVASLPETADPGPSSSTAGGLLGEQIRLVDQELRTLRNERTEVETRMGAYQARIEAGPDVEEQLRELERDYAGLLEQHRGLTSRAGEAELAGSFQRNGPFARFRVIDPAVAPQKPSSPMRILFLAGGLVLGLATVLGSVLLREMILEPLNAAAEVERYAGIPVLASVPMIETAARRRSSRQRIVLSWLAVGGVLAAVFVLRLMMRPF